MDIKEIIHVHELRDRLDNDMALLKDLYTIFITDSIKILDRVEDAIKNNDPVKLSKAAHTIKGAVSNFSAQCAYDAAFALEMVGKHNEMDKALDGYQQLKKEIDNMIVALNELTSKETF